MAGSNAEVWEVTSVCASAGRDLKLVAHVANVPENDPLRDSRFTDR